MTSKINDVRCNVVAPGFIDTKMNNNLTSEEKDEIANMTPLKRLGTCQDVANAIYFLASEKAKRLLQLTGGIVQGMSGSPIIQNGKIIGAVTHVFLNDPTKGYAVFNTFIYANQITFINIPISNWNHIATISFCNRMTQCSKQH